MGFDSFLGNARAVDAVRAMLARGRLPGALLFAGPDGVGKKTLAVMLAKAANCERQNGDFCGECTPCRKADAMLAAEREDIDRRRLIKDALKRVEGLMYFDVQLVEPFTRYILTDQVRQMRNVAYARPFELPRRVFVIDQAQTIHWQAIDLLLKMLEEPPATTTFILVCPNVYELRPTIRSRCRQVQFLPVEDALIGKLLAEEKKLTAAQRALALRIAAGSVAAARALDLKEFERQRQPWLDFLDAVASAAAAAPGGPAGTKSRPKAPNWQALFDSTKALTENREKFDETLRVGYLLLRDLVHALHSSDGEIANIDLGARLKTWASALGLSGIERLKNGLDQAYRLQIRNINQQIGLEALAIEIVSRQPAE